MENQRAYILSHRVNKNTVEKEVKVIDQLLDEIQT